MAAFRSTLYSPSADMFAQRPLFSVLAALSALLTFAPARAADVATGEQIYRKQCLSCHGATGEGSKEYNKQLSGEKSVAQLARVIARTMPDNDPGTLTAEQAEHVAAYMHGAFYSLEARERNRPPRIELARLTVRQYRNAVADLVGSFRPAVRWDERRGLNAEYFKDRRFGKESRVLERVDSNVNFDFGTGSPIPEKMDVHEFSIRWTGSLLAPETGEYEFNVASNHAVRFWLNDLNRPLIDGWVKSGDDKDHRATIFLLAGRVYPLRLEYTKAKQGVDDSKKPGVKKPLVPSSIQLDWKPPRRAEEAVPSRNFWPGTSVETFTLSTPFPPDDRSVGWERGTAVSKEWDQAATEAAVDTAKYISDHLNQLAGTRDDAGDRPAKLRAFCKTLVERAFRRPLTDEQKKIYIDRQFEAAKDDGIAVKRVVLLALKSPHFLYREVDGSSDSYDVAARLSFALWDAPPDAELLTAASSGRLANRADVVRQAERMLADPRARAKLQLSLLSWLKVEQAPDLAKDPKRHPGFDANIASDLRTSLELFLDDVVWSNESDFRQLFLNDELYLNGRLGLFYGQELGADADFQKMKQDPDKRAGVLTHPYLMAAFAYTSETSPIHRGVFLSRGVLGLSLRPPPEAFAPLAADLHPTLSTRERVLLQTKANACITCHGVINPLGFTLEHFDAVGRFRETDNAKPVDDTGSYITRSGKMATFSGPRQLAQFLVESEETHDAFVERLFHQLIQQPVRAYGPQTLANLRQSFEGKGYSIRKLVVEIVASTALTPRTSAKTESAEKSTSP